MNGFRFFSRSVSWKTMRHGVVRYKKFPLIDIWGALLNTISWQIPTLMLAAFFSPAVVGLYAMGNSVVRAPLNLVGGSIAKVFFQKASEAKTNEIITNVTERVFERLVAFGLFPLLMLSLVGEDLFHVILGAKWAEAGVYTQILAPWMFFTFISSPLSTLFLIFERQGTALIFQLALFLSRFISLYIGGRLGSVYMALLFFTFSGVIVYGSLCFWNLIISNVPVSFFLKIFSRYLMIFLPSGSLVFLVKHYLNFPSLITTFLATLLVTTYVLYTLWKDKDLSKSLNFNFSTKKGLPSNETD